MGNSNDCCSSMSCSFVKKDANAKDFDGSNGNGKSIKKNVLDSKALQLSKEDQEKAIAKWEKVEQELLLKL